MASRKPISKEKKPEKQIYPRKKIIIPRSAEAFGEAMMHPFNPRYMSWDTSKVSNLSEFEMPKGATKQFNIKPKERK
jgi:hypothetical protein